jgi:hypothetical protein
MNICIQLEERISVYSNGRLGLISSMLNQKTMMTRKMRRLKKRKLKRRRLMMMTKKRMMVKEKESK